MDQPLKHIETPLANELAETLLLQSDIHASLASMKLWREKYAQQPTGSEERTIGESLFRNAIIQFVECFNKQAKFSLVADQIYGADQRGLESFRWFQDMRDCWAAHTFGAQRQCVVGIVQDPVSGLAIGIGHLGASYRGQNKADGPQLVGFMQTAATYLDAKVERLRKEFLAEAQKMTKEEIDALKIAQVRPLSQAEVGASRRGFQKAMATGVSPTATRR